MITSACGGGSTVMGHAFTHNGKIEAYIGCRMAPDHSDMDVFVVNFFFHVMRKGVSDRDAWQKAMLATDQPEIYKISFFHRDGTEERYQEG